MIHVAIDARLPDKGQGGVQQVIRSLAEGFRLIETPNIRRSWIVLIGSTWWEGVFPSNDLLIFVKPPFGAVSLKVAGKFPKLVSRLYPVFSRLSFNKSQLDVELLKLDVDLVHMPFQDGFSTNLPYIYHPHDLQHHYFPQYFSKAQLNHRETVWKQLALSAKYVMAASIFVQRDLIEKWNVDAEHIIVMPVPPPTRTISRTDNQLQYKYIVYPAVFWKHKNHYRLVEAMEIVIRERPDIHCVLAGSSGPELTRVKRLIGKLCLESNVHIFGHVPEDKYGSLLLNSSAVIIPSLFEALSLTVQDAQLLGVQVLCSDLPMFHIQCAENAYFFDPLDPTSIANAILIACNSSASKGKTMGFNKIELSHSPTHFAREIADLYARCVGTTRN